MSTPWRGSLMRMMVLAAACLFTANAFRMFQPQPNAYEQGEPIKVDAGSITSADTQVPHGYYSLPICQATGEEETRTSLFDAGTLVSGRALYNSPYQFRVNEHEALKHACSNTNGSVGALTEVQAEDLKAKIRQGYRVQLELDGLPLTTADLMQNQGRKARGFPLGTVSGDDTAIFNHLNFLVLVHRLHGDDSQAAAEKAAEPVGSGGDSKGNRSSATEAKPMWAIVGFSVMPCSIKRVRGEPLEGIAWQPWGHPGNPEPQVVSAGEDIVYTYDVYWREVDIEWPQRWDAYLRTSAADAYLQRFSVQSSLMMTAMLSVIAVVVVMRTMRRDLAHHKVLRRVVYVGKDGTEDLGWMLVAGDVFREPAEAAQLATLFGAGVHVLCTVVATLGVAATDALPPERRGALATTVLCLYGVLVFAATYSAVWLWCNLRRSPIGWMKVCVTAAYGVPGVVAAYAVFGTAFNAIGAGDPWPAHPQTRHVALWLLISIGLEYCGGYMGASMPLVRWPKRTNATPRPIPAPRWSTNPYVMFAYTGFISFSTMYMALHLAMDAAWQGHFCNQYGFLLITFGMTVLNTALLSIVCTYFQLCAQDYNWWWRSFHRGGATAVFLILFAIHYLHSHLPAMESHGASVLMYSCYMSGVALVAYLCLGAVGLATSLAFVWLVYSRLDGVAADGREHVDCQKPSAQARSGEAADGSGDVEART